MNLKPLRVRIGMTQKEMAEKLGTTQQTIARWESGANAIPTKYLKDLAIAVGCSVADLLEIDETGRFKRRDDKDAGETEDDHLPYGAVRLAFDGEPQMYEAAEADKARSYEWPISQYAYSKLVERLRERSGWGGDDGNKGWLYFQTLNDRFVLVNPTCIDSVEFVSDDVEETPGYEHLEVYETINMILSNQVPSDDQMDSDTAPISRRLLKKAKAVIHAWGGAEPAGIQMKDLIIEKKNGTRSSLSIEESNVNEIIYGLLDHPKSSADHRFGMLTSEDASAATYFKFGSLRLLELSTLRWESLDV